MVEGEIIFEDELPENGGNNDHRQYGKTDNTVRNIIFALIILLILMCCCCFLLITAIIASGLGEQIMRELNVAVILPTTSGLHI